VHPLGKVLSFYSGATHSLVSKLGGSTRDIGGEKSFFSRPLQDREPRSAAQSLLNSLPGKRRQPQPHAARPLRPRAREERGGGVRLVAGELRLRAARAVHLPGAGAAGTGG
jgi:hypothetical protein